MRQKAGAHLAFIRSLPCVVCGRSGVEAAHVRFTELRAAKPITGMGIKPDDSWTLPLCPEHHREQHKGNERAFYVAHGIDPIFVALALWRATGDNEAGEQIVRHAYFHS